MTVVASQRRAGDLKIVVCAAGLCPGRGGSGMFDVGQLKPESVAPRKDDRLGYVIDFGSKRWLLPSKPATHAVVWKTGF